MRAKTATVAIDVQQIKALIERAESGEWLASDGALVGNLARLLLSLWQVIVEKNVTVAQLRKLLFGRKSEKRSTSTTPTQSSAPSTPNDKSSQSPQSDNSKKRKGHGRLAAVDYTGATTQQCLNAEIRPGSNCPNDRCLGRLYDTNQPEPFIRLVGRPVVDATNYLREVLRCSKCQQRFTAALPAGIKYEKFDVTADVSIVLHKYGAAMPFYRIAGLQQMWGIPLPSSTQFERAESVADKVFPIYRELERQAAISDLLHQDDTNVKILSLIQENKLLPKSARRGMHTTAVGARSPDIALYFSGRKYSAENLKEILKKRPPDLDQPIVVGDAEQKNWIKEFKDLVVKTLCLAHGRRKFVDCEAAYPQHSKKVLDDLAIVYAMDAQTSTMTPAQRLAFHQQHSKPIIDELKQWLDREVASEPAEPNGALGKALAYLHSNWTELTRFLTYPGAPLDNNFVERLLRKSVIYRKNALFYKTEHGAIIGDILQSIISTCSLNKVNAFDYFVRLIENASEVRRQPHNWLPWNYQQQLQQQLQQQQMVSAL